MAELSGTWCLRFPKDFSAWFYMGTGKDSSFTEICQN